MSKKYFTYNLGCRVNHYELLALENHLLRRGYVKGQKNDTDLDIVILNTCSVTATADTKSRKMINHFKTNTRARILVMGCHLEAHPTTIYEGLQVVVGTDQRELLYRGIDDEAFFYSAERGHSRDYKYEDLGIVGEQRRKIPEVKIEDGCNNFCAYCLIPLIRGAVRSRSPNLVLAEIKALVENGARELILVGINLGAYGQDFDDYRLVNLLQAINRGFPALIVHLSSLELSTLDEQLIQYIAHEPSIKRHFHIPLQSGSDHILARMNRRFSQADYLARIKDIVALMPDATFSSDIIVGFPGETEDDFQASVRVMEEVKFQKIHIFPYSIRHGTPAALMPDQVPPEVKKSRFQRLNAYNN